MTPYPCVPGHELAGVVTEVGRKVRKVKVGDHVGVGCMVDSCGDCRSVFSTLIGPGLTRLCSHWSRGS